MLERENAAQKVDAIVALYQPSDLSDDDRAEIQRRLKPRQIEELV